MFCQLVIAPNNIVAVSAKDLVIAHSSDKEVDLFITIQDVIAVLSVQQVFTIVTSHEVVSPDQIVETINRIVVNLFAISPKLIFTIGTVEVIVADTTVSIIFVIFYVQISLVWIDHPNSVIATASVKFLELVCTITTDDLIVATLTVDQDIHVIVTNVDDVIAVVFVEGIRVLY